MTNTNVHPHDGQPPSVRLRLGTRASALARWQADWVSARLTEVGVGVEMIFIATQGDVSTRPLGTIGGQGVFTKEIQAALLRQEIDLAVHSLKDLPTEPVANLTLSAVPERESTADVLVSAKATVKSLDDLPAGSRVGTGSVRRRAQLLHSRPDLQVLEIRGNVDTRLRKLDEGQYDAIILAEAGLRRLGSAHRITQVIPRSIMLPAVGQGALGLETRADDEVAVQAVASLDHPETRAAVTAERSMLAALRGGCLAPVAAWARCEDGQLLLDAVVLDGAGTQRLASSHRGLPADADALGSHVAEELLAAGAAELIVAARDNR